MSHFRFLFPSLLAFSSIFIGVFSTPAYAQILDPVHWSQEIKDLGNGEFELIMKAKMDDGWATYSQSSQAAVPTEISFEKANHFELIGKVEEIGKKKEGPDPLFDNLIVSKYYDHVDFVQKIKIVDKSKPIKVEAYFMSCNSEKCIPPTSHNFTFDLNGNSTEATPQGFGGMPSGEQVNAAALLDPVKLSATLEKKSDNTYIIHVKAKIQDGWHIYSHKIGEDGPVPSSLDLVPEASYKVQGDLMEKSEHRIELFDEIFEMKLVKYKEEVEFSQEILVTDLSKVINGSFTYQTCDASRCLPPKTVEFKIHPKENTIEMQGIGGTSGAAPINFDGDKVDQTNVNLIASLANPLGNCGEEKLQNDSLLWTFAFGFLGGLIALLTPCVFPMIPLTVSFFTKESKKKGLRNAILYGLSIIVIYVFLGLLITSIFGATALNELSTNWIANLIFFIIFVVFAFSFFGYFEITLPSAWANKSDSMAETGGLIGIFFMAFTLAIVSFSCTGPIVGSALVSTATSKVGPFVVMLGFSLALAIPFSLFAAFPAWLNSLPKSGSWMTNVKVVLGFLELALALKFLSNADMSRHWGILGYEVFMALWVIIFAATTLYLLGWIRFPHDSPVTKLSNSRKLFAFISLAATLYLATGFFYQKETNSYRALNLMSGLAPPSNYNYFLPKAQVDENIKARFMSFTKCANNLDCFKDYYEGLTYAKEVHKPILLDYTGIFCQNCRRTEDRIWNVDKVRNKIAKDYVLVSLYCDDPKKLDKEILSIKRNAILKTVGNKWADHQIVNFEQNSQPLYVLVSPDEKILAKPRGYRDGVNSYAEFLDCGLAAYKNN